ncbi:unnamed protein product [Pedinophyceae sp. YPF-701]|nr:unnamed protein product [Pedinophyceae sp. YPF-701]
MSDEVDLQFESADAGASHTIPQQAGTVRKGAFAMLKGRPVKVSDVSTAKTGKHGAAKCMFVGVDIFTGKKIEETYGSGDNMDVPNVARNEYQVLNVEEDGTLSLLMENGETKDDLNLPGGTDTLDKLAREIKEAFDDGKDIAVTVVGACGEEQIQAFKVLQL